MRPRKVENYRQMLEDEGTLKTIKDEEKEKKKFISVKDIDNEEADDEYMCDEIEHASDDEEVVQKEEEENVSEEEGEAEEEEDWKAKEGAKRKEKQERKSKEQGKRRNKRKQGCVNTSDNEEDEEAAEGTTVFIDNLPNDEFEIRNMLKEVRKHIKQLEKQFFEEEDSEREEELKQISNVAKHEEALQAFKNSSHLKQFWCIPLSVNVKDFDFDFLAECQLKYANRLFDVITIDPPWQLSSANPTRGVAIAYDTLNDKQILEIPFDKIQKDGFLFIWVINAKYRFALEMMENFGYK